MWRIASLAVAILFFCAELQALHAQVAPAIQSSPGGDTQPLPSVKPASSASAEEPAKQPNITGSGGSSFPLPQYARDQPHAAALWFIVFCLIVGLFAYWRQTKKFKKEFAELKSKLPRTPEKSFAEASAGQAFALASRGPSYAFDAELRSAEARWRQVIAAFPQLDKRDLPSEEKIVLVTANYSSEPAVHAMQRFVEQRVEDMFDKNVVKPEWVVEEKDFDVPKFPKLAIANPCFYSLPFFLTWQRRHLWGVLPYGTHSRLGVLVSKAHPERAALKELQAAYDAQVLRDREFGLWVTNPSFLKWLDRLLLKISDENNTEKPIKLDRGPSAESFRTQHKTPTVFTVGGYLHQELVPLACAARGNSTISTAYVRTAQLVEPSELWDLLPESAQRLRPGAEREKLPAADAVSPTPSAPKDIWPTESAVIVDLALINQPENPDDSEWELFRLPHGAYVPIGIGYSVLTWPLLVRSPEARKATAHLLAYSAGMLLRHEEKLSKIGIELDPRLWQHIEEV
jgi:hypothetical protein